jgi:hypothetical protein
LNSEIDSPLITDPPEPDAPEGFLLSEASLNIARQKPERETRIPGLALDERVPKCAGPAGGNEAMSRTPMAEQALRSLQIAACAKRRAKNFVLVCRVAHTRGSTNAGGEDVGYFASW